MEAAFGADFSSVRLHTGPTAEALNGRLGSRAFTTGSSIFVGSADAASVTAAPGSELLAHELAHVVQQDGATVRRFYVESDGSPGYRWVDDDEWDAARYEKSDQSTLRNGWIVHNLFTEKAPPPAKDTTAAPTKKATPKKPVKAPATKDPAEAAFDELAQLVQEMSRKRAGKPDAWPRQGELNGLIAYVGNIRSNKKANPEYALDLGKVTKQRDAARALGQALDSYKPAAQKDTQQATNVEPTPTADTGGGWVTVEKAEREAKER